MTPLTFAQTATYDLTPSSSRLPPFFWTAFIAINQIHGIWRWYRRIELYRHPDNFTQLLAGHITHLVLSDLLILRIAAQCLLITTRILECAEQQTRLYQCGQQWMSVFKGHYPLPLRTSWNQPHDTVWLSPSSSHWLKHSSCTLWENAKRITSCTAMIFIHLFTLSMRIMDAIDAFSLSPHTRYEGINEGFVNAMKCLNRLSENKEELLDGMTNNRLLIERLLNGSSITYHQLHSTATKALEKTEQVYRQAKKVSDFGNGILVSFGKRIVNGGMVVIGLAHYRPTALC
jgi:hypothetical protein